MPFAGSPQLVTLVTLPGNIVVSVHAVNKLSIGVMNGMVSVGGTTDTMMMVVSQKPISSQTTTHAVSVPVKLISGV